jgi:hypothetical protein
LRDRYGGRRQRFSRFPDANGNGHSNSYGDCYSHSNSYGDRHTNRNANSYGDGHCDRSSNWHTISYSQCHCHRDQFTAPQKASYANAAASSDARASPVGRCISANFAVG